MAAERTEGPTPSGGAYAIAYFLDDEGNDASKDAATRCEVVEYSVDGLEILRTHATIGESGATNERKPVTDSLE